MNIINRNKIIKTYIPLIISFVMLLGVFPWENIKVHGFEQDNYYVDSVTLFKIYDRNRNPEQIRVLITGAYLRDAEVGIITSTGYERLRNRDVNSEGLLQFNIDANQVGKKLIVGSVNIDLDEELMPTLTGITRKVRLGKEELSIQGTNLKNISGVANNISAKYEHAGKETLIENSVFENADDSVSFTPEAGSLGLQNIIFQKTSKKYYKFPSENKKEVTVNITYTYKDQFSLIRDIEVDDLTMRPNRGEKGDTVYFEAPFNDGSNKNLEEYDVFFLKEIDGTDLYTNDKKGTDRKFQPNVDGKSVLTVKVPSGLSIGEYYVVLTNIVSPNKDPMEEINQEKIMGKIDENGKFIAEKFTVIDGSIKSKIISVQPNQGPDTGSRTTITGQFIGTLNINEFTPNDSSINILTDTDTVYNPTELQLSYSTEKDGIVGWYNKGKQNEEKIKSVERTIKVLIGGDAVFLTRRENGTEVFDVSFNKDLDRIVVRTPQVTDAEENPKKDVVIETTTILTTDNERIIEIKERAQYGGKYTFIPSKVTPAITDVTPNKIQVVGSDSNFEIPEDRMVAIHGSNFIIHRYIKEDGTEVVRYPIIEFGNEIGLNKNITASPGEPKPNPNIQLKVLGADGRELDGTEGNEIGTKILVTIPAETSIENLGKTFVKVTNPVRNSEISGLSDERTDFIEFVNPDISKNPIIDTVSPDVVSVDGGEEVTITGTNFDSEVKVFIDGEEIKPLTRRGDGKEIKFKTPKGREGETQLQVMNPEGGMDTRPFTFVKTFTNPKITSFSPKKGNTGTLVIIKGENFIKPEPTAPESDIMRLIGTRVLLGDIEINEYNRDPVTKRIELQDYKPDENNKIFSIENNALEVADYIHSLVLEVDGSTPKRFYTLETNVKGEVILSDGILNTYKIELNEAKGKIVANKEGGKIHPLTISEDDNSITIEKPDNTDSFNPVTLRFKTPYKIENKVITGNKVKVVNINEIYFTVPILPAPGFYDVTVINPDTKKDSKTGNNGFEYFTKPDLKPEIEKIEPPEGSVEGGYTITITGKDFETDEDNKAKVYINGVEVKKEDTIVNVDGTEIKVKVPKYEGDLRKDKDTDRLTVPVVIVNPADGGTASREKGFTYVIPSSNPQITKYFPQSGTAAGGDVVEITGVDFRFYEPYDDKNRNQIFDPDEETFVDLNYNDTWDDLLDILKRDDETEEDFETRKKELLGETPLNHNRYDKYYNSSILPKISFGENQGKIVEFSRGYLKVITPPGEAGKVDLYILNNDSGISNRVQFIYESSNPKINEVIPAQGNKLGGDKVDLHGSGFASTEMHIYNSNALEDGKTPFDTVNMPLIRFSDISNRDIPRDQDHSGRIDGNRATVELPGELKVEYNGVDNKIIVVIEENDKLYKKEIFGYDNSIKFIPASLLSDGEEQYGGKELICVEVLDRRLIVERGYAPETELINSKQVLINTPSYYTTGKVPTVIINPDGGRDETEFEYKNPDSYPKIINITRDGQQPQPADDGERKILTVNIKGGSEIVIEGSDFRDVQRIQIGNVLNVESGDILVNEPNRLVFKMPAVGDGYATAFLHRVVVINYDGGVASSDKAHPPIYIQFTKGESNPEIESITPPRGPDSGGNTVIIKGKDFRETMEGYAGEKLKVYFDGKQVPDSDVRVIDYKTISVVAPPGTAGSVEVKVENPDGEMSNTVNYTYASNPRIISVVDPLDSTEKAVISTISIEGNQEIKLKGTGFMENARVYFAPKVTPVTGSEEGTGRIIYIEGNPYILEEGTEGTEYNFIDDETVIIKTPALKAGSSGVIIVNQDDGASPIYTNLIYGLPEIAAPSWIAAELVYDRFIRVHWGAVSGATEYEIFVVVDDKTTELIGSTRLTSFAYNDLEPRTRYKFIVKAVGDFGSSKPSLESNTVRTGRVVGPPDEDGELAENTAMSKTGNTANIVIGTRDRGTTPIVIDLTRGNLAGSTEVVISMPADVILQSGSRNIQVTGKDFLLNFKPSVFNVADIKENRNRTDAGVRFKIAPHNGNTQVVSGNQLSTVYNLDAAVYVGKTNAHMDYLAGPISLVLDYDIQKANLRKLNNVSFSYFSPETNSWQSVGFPTSTTANSVSGVVDRLGRYTVVGSRR